MREDSTEIWHNEDEKPLGDKAACSARRKHTKVLCSQSSLLAQMAEKGTDSEKFRHTAKGMKLVHTTYGLLRSTSGFLGALWNYPSVQYFINLLTLPAILVWQGSYIVHMVETIVALDRR